MQKHKKFWLIFLSIIVILALIITGWWHQQTKVTQNLKVQQSSTPTLFIPGFMGNRISFGGMIHRLAHNQVGTKAMVIHVSKNGQPTFDQKASLHRNNPLIQVLFKDNRQEKLQSRQLITVLAALKREYHVKQVNLVGHSSGGNIVFDYLINPKSKAKNAPKVVKYVNIATNFPGNSHDGKYLPAHLEVLNLAGNLWHKGSDGGILVKQDLYLGTIARPYVKSYQAQVVSGGFFSAYHSFLHENGEVDKLVAEFLFN